VPTAIVWSAGAQADLAEIYEFIARDTPRYAEMVVRSLLEAPELDAETGKRENLCKSLWLRGWRDR